MFTPARIAVFASGGGTNLQALLDYFNTPATSVGRVELVVASRSGIGALARAEAADVAGLVIDPGLLGGQAEAAETLRELEKHQIDLIALAGYLKLIASDVVERFRGRILNIHPALLPRFGGAGMYGLRVHRAVIASGCTVSGATVHFVDQRYDEGRILAQWPVPVMRDDTPEQLAARVLRVEHLLYPVAIEAVIQGEGANRRRVELAFDVIEAVGLESASIRRVIR